MAPPGVLPLAARSCSAGVILQLLWAGFGPGTGTGYETKRIKASPKEGEGRAGGTSEWEVSGLRKYVTCEGGLDLLIRYARDIFVVC